MDVFETYQMQFPKVGRNPFPFASVSYNFYGHPPIGVYDYQHFDARLFFVDSDWWFGEMYPKALYAPDPQPLNGTCADPSTIESMYNANIPVPVDCWPGSPSINQNVGHYMWGQGMHIYNLLEPGWQAYAAGTSINDVDSMTWGMTGGKITYVESMFSRAKAMTEGINECFDFADQIPKHFDEETWVPTRKCIVAGPSNVKVEYDKFVRVPGGCAELRNATDTELTGWFPTDLLLIYGPLPCEVPMKP